MVYDSDGLISKAVVHFACFILLCSDRFPIVNQIAHCQSQQTRLFTVEKMVEIHCCGRCNGRGTVDFAEHQTTRWTTAEKSAYKRIKELITKMPCLAHYSMEAEIKLVVDASSCGLGCVLL